MSSDAEISGVIPSENAEKVNSFPVSLLVCFSIVVTHKIVNVWEYESERAGDSVMNMSEGITVEKLKRDHC